MSYRIHSGDTLSGIAARFHVSLGALELANPQVHNPNLIHTGQSLNVPGQTDSFQPAPAKPAAPASGKTRPKQDPTPTTSPSGPATPSSPSSPSGSGRGQAAYDVARQYLGRMIADVKANSDLKPLLDHTSNKASCANFVSACLEKAGLIPKSGHTNRGSLLAKELSASSDWKKVSIQDAKPGDVVELFVPGEGPYGHTVMFSHFDKNGKPVFIGSNNTTSQVGLGPQKISETRFGHGITVTAVFHYTGGSNP